MTAESFDYVWTINHCLQIASFKLLDENETSKCFNWVHLGPMHSSENNLNGPEINIDIYLLKHIKAQYFLKLNEERE